MVQTLQQQLLLDHHYPQLCGVGEEEEDQEGREKIARWYTLVTTSLTFGVFSFLFRLFSCC